MARSVSTVRPGWLAAVAAALLLLAGMWIASQGGIVPRMPAKFAGSLDIVLTSLPLMAALWLGAAGLGAPLRHWLAPQARHGPVVQLGLGLGAMLTLDWLLAWAGWLNTATAWGLCGVGGLVLFAQLAPRLARPMTRLAWRWTTLAVMPIIALLLVAATCPPGTIWRVEANGYDVLSYHLQVPRQWLDAGGMIALEHNVFSFLPMFVEVGYMQLGAMAGSMTKAIYATQLFHASAAILAAWAMTGLMSRFVNRGVAVLAGAALLAVPWTVMTGSLAYDEMFVLAFGATALGVSFDRAGRTRRGAFVVGLLLGWATLAKLPAAAMIALPMLWIPALRSRRIVASTALVVLGMTIVVAPWLARNATWTGNPVFPFAAEVLGRGHWDQQQVERWNRAHSSAGTFKQGLAALDHHWWRNTGYGAVGGRARQRGSEVARFDREGGVPLLWLAAAGGAVFALRRRAGRTFAAAMLVMLAVQLAFWLLATHHQSRFLTPTLLPGCALAVFVFDRLRRRAPATAQLGAVAFVLLLTVNTFAVFFDQTDHRPWLAIDSLTQLDDAAIAQGIAAVPGDHVLNHLPPGARIYLVADVGSLLYLRGTVPDRFVYHTAFDASLLGQLIRRNGDDAAAITAALRRDGLTHVWVGWSELARLQQRGRYDPAVTVARLRRIADTSWQPVHHFGYASLYALAGHPPRQR